MVGTLNKGRDDVFLFDPDLESYAMHLASNDTLEEHSSETDPILSESQIVEEPQGPLHHCEVSTVDMDASVADDIIDIDADENCALLNSEQPQCRICLDSEGEDLIAPCHCRGTQKYVHRSCLDNWRSAKEGFAFAHCTECRAQFLLRANSPSNRRSILKFQLLVARDHALIFIVVQLIVALFGILLYKLYGEELREMFGYEDHPYGFYIIAVLAILLVGLLYGLLIAIICGQRINERHYHVLAKQDLTKEYIVEDRGKNDVAELDPSHISVLRMLGLY